MGLRSGIILPFQYRDTKKLLMCGVPEENRELTFFDLKNVVRAAFGIYNFEFRNKKIGFNIPDELLLHYLAQRHDLTNFVLEINQAHDDAPSRKMISYEPSCSTGPVLKPHNQHVPLPQKSNESGTHDYTNAATSVSGQQDASPVMDLGRENDMSPMDHTNHSDDKSSSHADLSIKPRIAAIYSEEMAVSLTQSIDPMIIVPKTEEAEQKKHAERFAFRQQQQHPQQPHPHPHTIPHHMPTPQFFPNYPHSLLGAAANPIMSSPPTPQQSPYTPGSINRFRIFEAQQDNNEYAIYSHCRCGAQKLRADSPPPEPTNLCQPPASHSPIQTTLLPNTLSADEQECLQAMKLRLVHMQNNVLVEEKAAGSSTASDLQMNAAYEPCSPKMDCDSQEELLPDSPSSQHHHHHHQNQQQQQHLHHQLHQQQHDEERYLRQQQQQHQQHIEALLQEQHNTSPNNTSNMNSNNNNNNNSNSMPPTTPTTNTIRQRKERMSKRQKELYVTFLQQYPFINEHRRNDPALDTYWHKLANLLNAVPQGAVKHVTEWKQTFDNWRYRVFLYARFNSKLRGEEALNPRNFKPLTRTDKHAYAIWIQNPDTAPPDLDKMRNVFMNLEETQQE